MDVMHERDCDTCKIASYSTCIRCEHSEDPKDEKLEWVKKKNLDNGIDWEEVYKKQGAWR